MYRALNKVIITLIIGQGEVVKVGLAVMRLVVMSTKCRPEAIIARASAVVAYVGIYVVMIPLAYVGINSGIRPIIVVVVAEGDDEIGVPAPDLVSYVSLLRVAGAIITNGGEAYGARSIGRGLSRSGGDQRDG